MVDFRHFIVACVLILLRCFTPTSTTKPTTNVKLGGSTCAWTKIPLITGQRNLASNVWTGMFQPGRNQIGQLARQVSFGCSNKSIFFLCQISPARTRTQVASTVTLQLTGLRAKYQDTHKASSNATYSLSCYNSPRKT